MPAILLENNEKERYGVDMRKKALILGMVLALSMMTLVGCGAGDTNNSVTDQATESPAADDTNRDDTDRNDNTYVSPDADDGVVDDLEDGVNDAVDGAEDAVDDVIDGTEDAVDDAGNALDGNDTNNNTTNKNNNNTTNKNTTKNTR